MLKPDPNHSLPATPAKRARRKEARPGELLESCRTLRIVAFEDGFCSQPDRFVQRIAAIHEGQPPAVDSADETARIRYLLDRA